MRERGATGAARDGLVVRTGFQGDTGVRRIGSMIVRTGVVVVLVTASATGARASQTITLDEALRRADQEHPDIQAGGAGVAVAQGELLTARTRPYNPEVGAAAGPAFGGGSTILDFEVSVSQTVELGGKLARRVAVAEARRDVTRARLEAVRQTVASRVRRAFFLALVARDRLETTTRGEAFAEELKAAAEERLRVGAGTRLEANVASAAAGRARRERLDAERRYAAAGVEIAAAIGAPAQADFEPEGELERFPALGTSEAELVARALGQRAELAAAGYDRTAARAELALANSLAIPDIRLSASYGRAEDFDVAFFGVSVPVPLWNRHQGGRASAAAGVRRAIIIEESARREVERQVRLAYRSYLKAREAVQGFGREVVERIRENLDLARESFRSGKIGLLDLNIVRRELVETRLAYLDAQAEAIEAWFGLEAAVGARVE